MNFYTQLQNSERLYAAFLQVEEGSPVPGTDGITPALFRTHMANQFVRLIRALKTGSYTPHPLLRFYMPKLNGKWRMILLPTVRDRVLQRAVTQLLQPTFEAEWENISYAYRPGKSWQEAVRQVAQGYEAGYRWIVEVDIQAYFDEIPHDLLIQRVSALIGEPAIVRLIEQWITAPAMADGVLHSRSKGIPQGSVISPHLANLYLDDLDEALIQEGYKIIRYGDDFVILCKSESRATSALQLTQTLLTELKLVLNPAKTGIARFTDGFSFLGQLFIGSMVLPDPVRQQQRKALKNRVRVHRNLPQTLPIPSSAPPLPLPEVEQNPSDLPAGLTIHAEVHDTVSVADALSEALKAKGLTPHEFRERLPQTPPEPSPQRPPEQHTASLPTSRTVLRSANPLDGIPRIRHFLRTLYIREQGAWMQASGERIQITLRPKDAEKPVLLADIPVLKIGQILILGSVTVSPSANRLCLQRGIPITFCSTQGRYYGRTDGGDPIQINRQRAQFLLLKAEQERLTISRLWVQGKLRNSLLILRRKQREKPAEANLNAIRYHEKALRRIAGCKTAEALRGLEGKAAWHYFAAFAAWIGQDGLVFTHRQRRPPPDPVNAMLSLGYTLLYNHVHTLLHLHRLQPYVGVWHEPGRGHAALASDVMEPFRCLIDRMVLRLINQHLMKPTDFWRDETKQACYLKKEALKRFLTAWEDVLNTEIRHPKTGKRQNYRECLETEVLAFLRYVLHRTPYEPFTLPR